MNLASIAGRCLLLCTTFSFAVAPLALASQSEPLADAPDFVSRDLEGKEVRLADFKDKIVLLDFWATWCGPCMQAMPHTQELAKKYKAQGVIVLAVCTSDSRAKFEVWAAANQAKYPDVRFTCDIYDRESEKYDDRASAALYKVPGLPTQFVISAQRKIAATISGYEDKGDARSEAGLARLGIKVDEALVAKGEAQLARDAAEALASARQAELNSPPSFSPKLGTLKSGDLIPDVALVGADGGQYLLSSLRGKTLVLGFGWDDVVPIRQLRNVSAKHSTNGVLPIAVLVSMTRKDSEVWLARNPDLGGVSMGWDPAGKYTGDREQPDMKAMGAWEAQTVVRKLLGGPPLGGTPAMPIFAVVDSAGRFVGVCWAGDRHKEGLANLLLRAGVKLAPEDMPKKVAAPADFVPEPPPPPEADVEQLAVGALAPDFTTSDVNNKLIKLSDYKGKVVVLDFWATWCGPCISSMPHTQDVAAQYKSQGVVVIGSCTSDKRANFNAWVLKNQSLYPDFVFAHDAAEKKPERASRTLYGVSGIPSQFVIGRDGRVAAFVSGYREGEVLLEAALAKAGIEVAPEILARAAEDQRKRDAK